MRNVPPSADYGERRWRLLQAKSEGDTDYVIESLRRDPELAPVSAELLADAGIVEAIPTIVRTLDVAYAPA